MSGELCYFTIGVPEPERARTFYGSLLGWEFAAGDVPGGWHITNASPPGGLHGGGGGVRVYFQVDDVEAAVARVRELGGEAEDLQASAAGSYVSCRDDQGVAFSLFGPARST